jgi:glucosamine--fructose-6-phosphate aminotransferase (isomerizing)
MCGIVGYIGSRAAAPLLLDGLARLEYRGYDSAGIAVQNGHGINTRKIAGRVDSLRRAVSKAPLAGGCGIGHTRWATHGPPTTENAHPHADCGGHVAVVHNGIIENAGPLRQRLECAGHHFASDTDTEVLAHLIESSPGAQLEDRVLAALQHIVGTYGIAVMSADDPHKIVAARQGSPVLLGVGTGEGFVASDPSALCSQTRSVVYLDDGDLAVVTSEGYSVIDRDAHPMERPVNEIDWDVDTLELGGHAHYMIKEIHEQPVTVENAMRGRLVFSEGTSRLNGLNLDAAACERIQRILIVACGTSWHAGLVGRYIIERLTGIPVDVEYASEFRYRDPVPMPGTLTVAISQSGETADTLEAIRHAKSLGSTVVGLVNVVGSSIARNCNGGIYLHAGPEVGVASTKAFTSQIVALILLGLHLGRHRGMERQAGQRLIEQLLRLPDLVAQTLRLEPEVLQLAERLRDSRNALYLGRGVSYPVALEGALKLKEVSYVHAEGYPAAEMKHGPIALVDEEMPVLFVMPKDELSGKTLSNLQEVKARRGRIIAVTTIDAEDIRSLADTVFRVPACGPLLSPLLTVIPLQLLAYHVAVLRGCDVDRPRNLAKSVTVE